MTGIERLRGVAGFWRENRLEEIIEQIEREQVEAAADHAIVASVASEMERHVSGAEGMEDSPVARWARELREALDGEERDPAADVSMSAYDLLSQEERDAIAWVREHGGLDAVREKWDGSVDVDVVSRMVESHKAKRERLKSHALLLERKCAERGETIRELEHERDELRTRLMPEGMEWLVESWPRFEDDAPVCIGDEISWRDEGGVVNSIELQDGGYFILHAADGAEDWILPQYFPGERVKRPAPKVLDADGAEIRVGDDVWDMGGNGPYKVVRFTEQGYVRIKSDFGLERSAFRDRLTHRAPVLAADGKPLSEGETVFDKDTGDRFEVNGFSDDGFVVCWDVDRCEADIEIKPDQLTHERPVVDTWERLEEDAHLSLADYCKKHESRIGHPLLSADMHIDLVRRAKALAERDR